MVLRLLITLFLLGYPLDSFCAPAKSQKPITKRPLTGPLIVLDPGHGGFDMGANSHSCDEKSLSLKTAIMVKKHLNDLGYRVVLTRMQDVFIPLKKRALIANQTQGKLFVSLHYNAAKSTEASGIEVFYHESPNKWRSTSSQKLAKCVLNRMVQRTGSRSRGVKKGNFHVIRETKMPAILVEGGFITHEKERGNLKDNAYIDKIARGVAEGVHNYFKA